MNWPTDIQSTTPAKYLFKLVSETDECICNPEPIDWKSGTLEMKRDLEAGGVFSSFQVDSMTFIGNGAEFIKKLFNAYGLNAKCTLTIYYWKNFDNVTPANGRQYIEFPTRYDINFSFYEKVKIGRFYFGVRVKAINSSTQTKLDNRQDVDVDITKLTTIGGVELKGYGYNDANLKKGLHYDQTYVAYVANLMDIIGSYGLYHLYHKVSYTSVPMKKITSDFAEVQDVRYYSNLTNLTSVPSFLKNSEYDMDLTLHYQFEMRVSNRYWGTSEPYRVQVLETKESSGVTEIVFEYDIAGFGRDSRTYIYNDMMDIHVSKGNDLKLVVKSEGINASYTAYCEYTIISIEEKVANTESTLTEGFPLYEAIERTCQHILDAQYPIYSEFFGRQDTVYNGSLAAYPSEDQRRFAHIQTGMNQRGVKLSDENAQLAISFKNLFKTIKAIWNVGYTLETLAGETNQRIRIEEYAHFFDSVNEMVFDPPLSERITEYDIQAIVMPELAPVDVKSGFDNYEYLSINGRGEPNTVNQRTSIMNTSTKWENLSPYRSDTKGIIDNLSNPVITTDGSKDTKGDSSVFIVKSQRDATYGWKPEKSENVTVDPTTSLFKDDLLNRLFTPTRMLIRHGNRLAAGMTRFPASVLKFQKTDKWSVLETAGEGYTIKENADILISDLGSPIYKEMKYTAIIPGWTHADTEILQAHPFRYIKFSYNVSGYLLSFKKKNNEDKAEISIIEKY